MLVEDGLDKSGQRSSRAGLYESADTRFVHVLDLPHELDRVRQLSGQQLHCLPGILWIRFGRRIGVNGDVARVERDVRHRFGERALRFGYQSAVKCRCYRKLSAPDLLFLQFSAGELDLIGRSGQDDLGRRVTVGDDQVQ